MATNNPFSTDHSTCSAHSDNADFHSPPQTPSSLCPIQDTLDLVKKTKEILQQREKYGKIIDQTNIEYAVSTAKMNYNPEDFDLTDWRRKLPSDILSMPIEELLASMAYVNNRQDMRMVCREKTRLNQLDESKDDPNYLKRFMNRLQRLKEDLDYDEHVRFLLTVRTKAQINLDQAIRYFYIEVHHRVPTLTDYTWDDAKVAVDAICQTNCELENDEHLLALTETCKGYDTLNYLKHLDERTRGQFGR